MKTAVASRNRKLDAERVRYNSGYQRWYSGTRPTNADTALSGNTLLVELRFNATAFAAASGGVITANAMAGGAAAAGGTVTFVRNFESDGTTVLSDMSIGLSGSGAEVITDRVTLVAGDVVNAPTPVTITEGVGT